MPKKAIALAFTTILCPYLLVCGYPAHANTWTTPDGATIDGLPVAASANTVNNLGSTYTVTPQGKVVTENDGWRGASCRRSHRPTT